MSVQSRKVVREEVGAILTMRLASLAQQVYTDQPNSFDGQSPVVVVTSDGSEREGQVQRTFSGPIAPKFMLDIYVFVLVTTTNADDALDELEAAVAEFVSVYPSATTWTAIGYRERSETTFVTVLDGSEYKRERIPLVLTGKG
jgi:hypothetical protein